MVCGAQAGVNKDVQCEGRHLVGCLREYLTEEGAEKVMGLACFLENQKPRLCKQSVAFGDELDKGIFYFLSDSVSGAIRA